MNTRERRCDLHIHSDFSDSDASVEDIFAEARKEGLSCVAITDHDTVSAVDRARGLSRDYRIELIEGIELSAQHLGCEVHILGYFLDADSQRLRFELSRLKKLREDRMIWMAEKLNSLGLKVDIGELFSRIKGAAPTRMHLGLYLVEKGYVISLKDSFNKYLSPGRPAYCLRFKYSVAEAINFIKDFGGVAMLAHPHMLSDQSWIKEFIALGLNGLEVAYHNMPAAKRLFYEELARSGKLLKSGGSDAHGSYKKFTKIGRVTIPYAWVREMKECLKIPIT